MMVVVAAGLARLAGAPLAFWRPRALWVRSLAGSFSLVCNFYALSTLPVADAVTLMNVQPLWVVLTWRRSWAGGAPARRSPWGWPAACWAWP